MRVIGKSSTPRSEVNLTDSIYASRYCDELPRARRLYRVLSFLQTTKVCSSERKIREKFLSQRSLVTLVQGDSTRAHHFFLDITFHSLYTFNQLQQNTVAIHEKWKGRIDSWQPRRKPRRKRNTKHEQEETRGRGKRPLSFLHGNLQFPTLSPTQLSFFAKWG